ncbi:MAG: isoprenylcysteine carboxylmethyltransferase family protein [Candidatus Baltobacteraceae bacterium]
MSKGPNTAGVVAFPPLIYGIPLLTTLIVDRVTSKKRLPAPLRLLSIGFFAAAASVMAPSFREFGKAQTPVDPFEETTALVQSGPYAYTRNPIYVGLTLAYAGVAFAAGSGLSLAALPVIVRFMNAGVIEREERYLEQKFGEQYRRYKAKAPRWLY